MQKTKQAQEKSTELINTRGKGFNGLVGQILQNRYRIGELLDEGSQGKVFEGIDITKDQLTQTPLIIKFSEQYEALAKEIRILKKLRKMQKELHGNDERGSIPHMANFGMLVLNDQENQIQTDNDDENLQLVGYFVMKRYNQTLEQFVCNKEKLNNIISIEITIQLLDAFKVVHACDRTYNDLKLQNVMVSKSRKQANQITLIDYGFADKFRDDDGNHISQFETVDTFQGNMLFASTDQLEFKRTTRRDDLISLTYLMLFLLNNCEFPCLPAEFYKSKKNEQIFEKFNMMKKFKMKTPISKMIKNLKLNQDFNNDLSPTEKSVRASFVKQIETLLGKFVGRIEALTFDEKPDYAKLTETLTQCHQVMCEIHRIGEICKSSEKQVEEKTIKTHQSGQSTSTADVDSDGVINPKQAKFDQKQLEHPPLQIQTKTQSNQKKNEDGLDCNFDIVPSQAKLSPMKQLGNDLLRPFNAFQWKK